MTNRRGFIKKAGVVSAGFMGLQLLAGRTMAGSFLSEASTSVSKGIGYGPLIPDPKGVLNLPAGFNYRIISRQGEMMSDGLIVPGKMDGMATFKAASGKTIIVRNHEISSGDAKEGAFGKDLERIKSFDQAKFYDYGRGKRICFGGTTTLVYNDATGKVESQYLSLAGTTRNCAGGSTPWNTWITCEESVEKADTELEKDHGWCFEVPASETRKVASPFPLRGLGRFNHEACVVDPKTKIVYLTEDRGDGLLYRFIPNKPGDLMAGGRLQALAIRDAKSYDTRNWPENQGKEMMINQALEADWIDLDHTDAPEDDLRIRGFEKGAAVFARGEGAWFGEGEFYFTCTNGGKKKLGQIFKYVPSPKEGTKEELNQPGKLFLHVESADASLMKSCDNITVMPHGGLMICEDDDHPFLIGITPDGQPYKFGEQIAYKSELTGACFSPDGKTMFFNIQHEGLTLAVTGPWEG